ncbi:CPBP family intramembrane glutamic endopeptidase [Catenuloplanes japonicus]|uniref:CPBP family intramembrane glutamic endopeptidase n=1 Tax=Catenuloplanes japonicus TaxID=33876 RepID=UPI00068FE9A6|nr:type II CAAX endopeptidase family protein [Catenuloplanes japonicus]
MTQQSISIPRADVGHTTAYLIGAFVLSWIPWSIAASLGAADARTALVFLGGFGPMVAAIAVTARTGGRPAVRELLGKYKHRRGSGRAYLMAPVILLAAALTAAGSLLTGATLDTGALLAVLPALPVMIVMIALVGGGNEELGWRGFLSPRLRSALPPAAAHLTVGLIWAVWHAPLWLIPGTAQQTLPFAVFAVTAVAISILLGWATQRAGGGILPAVLAHTALNVGLSLLQAALGDVPLVPLTALLLAAALVVARK